jgi:hypothetical protein
MHVVILSFSSLDMKFSVFLLVVSNFHMCKKFSEVVDPLSGIRLSRTVCAKVFDLGSAKTSYINQNETPKSLNLKLALILALTKIRRQIEMLACQKQAQSPH